MRCCRRMGCGVCVGCWQPCPAPVTSRRDSPRPLSIQHGSSHSTPLAAAAFPPPPLTPAPRHRAAPAAVPSYADLVAPPPFAPGRGKRERERSPRTAGSSLSTSPIMAPDPAMGDPNLRCGHLPPNLLHWFKAGKRALGE